MLQSLRTVTIVIPDYDQAIAWYTGVLGFDLLEDIPQTPGKRWVVVAPPGASATPGACQFLLARAATPPQTSVIGNQTGGRVAFFLTTTDFAADFQRLTAAGVHFLETPRHEPYGWVVQFADPWGNKYDLLEAQTQTTNALPSEATAHSSSVPPSVAQAPASSVAPSRSEAYAPDSSVAPPPSAAQAPVSSVALPSRRSEAHASPTQQNQAAGPSAAADARSGAPRVAQHSDSYVSNGEGPATKQVPGNRPRRYGFVGILVPHDTHHGPEIQRILSDHADLIQGRMGLPHLENDTLAVITLIVRASPDELGSLTGRLGRLEGVTVKSGLAPLKDED